MRRALAAFALLAAFAACQSARHSASTDGSADAPPPTPACSPTAPEMPRAFIGPDVSLRVVCGGRARAAIASVDEHGAGVTSWHVTLSGDPAFTVLGEASFKTCATTLASVATVEFVPPPTASLSDSFDAVATVFADGAVFPRGTVKLHGEVFQPVVTVDRTSVDFGDSDLQLLLQRPITFHVETADAFISAPHAQAPFDFSESAPDPATGTFPWTVFNMAAPPGDYTYDSVWSISGESNPTVQPACAWTATIPLHIRIVGAADAGIVGAADAGIVGDAGPDS